MNARREQLDRSPTEALPNVGLTHESEHLPCTSPCPLSANSAPLPKSVLRGSLVLSLRAISPGTKIDSNS